MRNESAEMKTASLAAGKGIGGEAVSSTKAVPLFYDILAPNNRKLTQLV